MLRHHHPQLAVQRRSVVGAHREKRAAPPETALLLTVLGPAGAGDLAQRPVAVEPGLEHVLVLRRVHARGIGLKSTYAIRNHVIGKTGKTKNGKIVAFLFIPCHTLITVGH